jgi:hypothetical protein
VLTVVTDCLAVCMSAIALHAERHHRTDAQPPMHSAVASWYEIYGPTASGWSYTYGFASLIFGSQWGKRVMFCYRGKCQIGRLDDHGPYVSGRTFDLSPPLRAALSCPDLCNVRWRAM